MDAIRRWTVFRAGWLRGRWRGEETIRLEEGDSGEDQGGRGMIPLREWIVILFGAGAFLAFWCYT